jgi:hypothetical protein
MEEEKSNLEQEGLLEKPIRIEIRKFPNSIAKKQMKVMSDFIKKKLSTSSKMKKYFVELNGEFIPPKLHLET